MIHSYCDGSLLWGLDVNAIRPFFSKERMFFFTLRKVEKVLGFMLCKCTNEHGRLKEGVLIERVNMSIVLLTDLGFILILSNSCCKLALFKSNSEGRLEELVI